MKFAAISATLTALAALAAPAAAAPIQARDVFVPQVLYPHASTVWYHGQTHNVTWDITHVPKQISNKFSVRLRSNGLITPLVLADGFDPRAGHVEVTVPWVTAGTYSLVLFGDSGNYSPEFQILGGPAY